MGEPATPTESERADTRAFANDIMEAVLNDERHPLSPGDHGTFVDADEADKESAMYRLAWEVDQLKRELAEMTEERDQVQARIEELEGR